MLLRDIKKQKTAEEFMEAIQRILDKQPKCPELLIKLREGKPLKLNKSNVEKEAGKKYGATKNHPAILEEIDRINRLNAEKIATGITQTNNLKDKVNRKNEEVKSLEKKLEEKNAEIETLKLVNLKLHAHCRELTSALYNQIPQEVRKDLFHKKATAKGDNVISFIKDD